MNTFVNNSIKTEWLLDDSNTAYEWMVAFQEEAEKQDWDNIEILKVLIEAANNDFEHLKAVILAHIKSPY